MYGQDTSAVPSPVTTKEPSPLVDRLLRVDAATALTNQGVAPWHLKMDVQLFDATGKARETGTIEEWWAAPGRYRIVYNTPSYKAVVLQHDGDALRTKNSPYPPNTLETLLTQVSHPMPWNIKTNGILPSLQQQTFGTIVLDCIMLNLPIADNSKPPLGLFPTYCMDPAKNSLRASFNLGRDLVLRNAVSKFQNKTVATSVSYRVNDVDAGTSHVTTLEAMSESSMDLAPSEDLEGQQKRPSVPGNVIAGYAIHKVLPVSPDLSASGTVILSAVIARDGSVYSIRPVSVPSASMALAAIAAARRWTYKPYLLNGMPVEVDTTLTFNFKRRPL